MAITGKETKYLMTTIYENGWQIWLVALVMDLLGGARELMGRFI